MECKTCGTPIAEGDTFCGACGSRLQAENLCPACGYAVQPDHSYCAKCGARLDGKVVCNNCGTEFQGNFCPSCGQAKRAPSPRKATKDRGQVAKQVFTTVGHALLIFGALMSLIFVFFLGLETSMEGEAPETAKIYTFFGEYYEDMEETTDLSGLDLGKNQEWWENVTKKSVTAYGVQGTLLSAAVLLCVSGFAIVALTKYIYSWVTGKKDTSGPWALAAAISYLAGVMLFFGYIRMEMNVLGTSAEVAMTGATLAGVILCTVSVALGLISHLCSQGSLPWSRQSLVPSILSLVGVALVVAVAIGGMHSAFGFQMEYETKYAEYSVELLSGFGITCVSQNPEFAATFAGLSGFVYNQATSTLVTMNVCGFLAQLAAVLLVVFAALALWGTIRGLFGKRNLSLLWSGLSLGSAIALLVCDVLTWQKFESLMYYQQPGLKEVPDLVFRGLFGTEIATLVLSVLLLAVCTVGWVFRRKKSYSK